MKERQVSSSLPLIDKLPRKVRKPVYGAIAAVGLTGVAALGAVCEGNKEEEPAFPPEAFSRGVDPVNYDPSKPFRYPVPIDQRIQVQQGWNYDSSSDSRHDGIDYIFGEYDDSGTWKPFPVLAAYDGQACVNPKNRLGDAVLVKHDLNGQTYYSYYGHLQDIKESIPQCEQEDGWNTLTKSVVTGEGLGKAGSTGVVDEDWVHLHFSVIGPDGNYVDPYDVYGKRAEYPDLLHQNGNVCGEKTLFANCPTTGADDPMVGGATYVPATETPIPTLKPVEVPTPTHTPRPVEVDPNDPNGIEARAQANWEQARLLGERFINLMNDGSPEALDQVLEMQIREEEKRILPDNQYDVAPLSDIEECSKDMKNGGFNGWNVQKYPNVTRYYRGLSQAERLNREQGLLQNDRFAVGVNFIFNRYNRVGGARVGYEEYDMNTYGTYLVFEDVNGQLKLAYNEFCFGNNSPIGNYYDWEIR